jgi:nicotinamidase-related amidase
VLEKQTLDVFSSTHAHELVMRLGPDVEFVVFGVVTEFCVGLAAKGLLDRGRRVSVVRDAIETLNSADGNRTLAELQTLGATLITTERALTRLNITK